MIVLAVSTAVITNLITHAATASVLTPVGIGLTADLVIESIDATCARAETCAMAAVGGLRADAFEGTRGRVRVRVRRPREPPRARVRPTCD
jgi:hypothetical protein